MHASNHEWYAPMTDAQLVVPFLKWAGGKRWLVHRSKGWFPKTYKTYFEPFLGSGAVFFHLRPKKAVLSDINAELVNAYRAVQNDWQSLERILQIHHDKHSNDYYYEIRSKKFKNKIRCAGQFIYLNRTCWNGLYRVNLRGEFNVPIGTKSNVLLGTDNFAAVASLLEQATLLCSDFEEIINLADDGDLIFADPPYTIQHNQNGFRKYNEVLFNWKDQLRLKECLLGAANRGAHIILTNADHPSIKELYADEFQFFSSQRRCVIAARSCFRSTNTELIIKSRTNGAPK